MKSLLLFFFSAFLCLVSINSFSQNALNFDGTNDFVQTTFPGVQGSNDRTFEAWINVEPGAPASNLCITDYGLNAVGSRNTFMVNGSRGLSYISGGTNANIGSSTNVITEGVWTHVAFVLDSGVGYLYVNGNQVGTGPLTSVNTPSGNQNLIIGQRVTGGSISFEGSIDEVRIWNIARTPQEIQADTARELCLIQSGLVAYYKFNQGIAGGSNNTVTTLFEDVASNDGSLTGFALTGNTSNWVNGKILTPSALIQTFDTVTTCGSYTSPSGNNVWTSSGNYLDTVLNPMGCDTAININLTIYNHSTTSIAPIACDSFISPSGNYVYTSNGTYMDTIPNANGCDSVITINLVIREHSDSVAVNGNTLTAVQNGGTYQWYLCQAGLVSISGAVSQSYNITQTGNYAVIINKNGCIDTSDCILVILSGLENNDYENIRVYPNLTDGEITIDGSFEGTLSLIDSKGILVFEAPYRSNSKSSFSIPTSIQNGMYFLQFQNDKVNLRRKVFLLRD